MATDYQVLLQKIGQADAFALDKGLDFQAAFDDYMNNPDPPDYVVIGWSFGETNYVISEMTVEEIENLVGMLISGGIEPIFSPIEGAELVIGLCRIYRPDIFSGQKFKNLIELEDKS